MKKIILVLVVILILIPIYLNVNRNCSMANKPVVDNEVDYLVQPPINYAPFKEKVAVKGIYMTSNTVGYEKRFNELIDLISKTELNAVVIDIKDDFGDLTYSSDIPFVKEIGSDKNRKVEDINPILETLREKDIYPIARIVTFKDRIAASKKPELAVKSEDGSIWRDNKGNAWLNPYNKDSWEYPIKVAEEAALKGFKEIQFDYVRFPSDGRTKEIDYGQAEENKTMVEAIAEFLEYARERLEPLGVYVSADVFGIVTTSEDDLGLGQHLETIATSVDILSPMVYPSHYDLGSFGILYPDAEPYKIVYTSLDTAIKRIEGMADNKNKVVIRPWLQDFSAPWLKKQYGSHYTDYGPKEIKAQIKACKDLGLKEWIFWNAGNVYTKEGYEKNNK